MPNTQSSKSQQQNIIIITATKKLVAKLEKFFIDSVAEEWSTATDAILHHCCSCCFYCQCCCCRFFVIFSQIRVVDARGHSCTQYIKHSVLRLRFRLFSFMSIQYYDPRTICKSLFIHLTESQCACSSLSFSSCFTLYKTFPFFFLTLCRISFVSYRIVSYVFYFFLIYHYQLQHPLN